MTGKERIMKVIQKGTKKESQTERKKERKTKK